MRTIFHPIACMLLLPVLATGCAQTTVVREPSAARAGKQTSSRPAQTPRPGSVVTVRKGETMYRIATQHGLSPLDLAMWNRIPPPYTIYPGQRLRLSPPDIARQDRPATSQSTPKPVKPVAGTAAPENRTSTPKPAAPLPAPTPVPEAAFDWRWPAEGNVIGRFAAGDPTRQGIDIAGKSGAPVRAAADGVVVYSGAGLVGYGELIIIKHSDQWLTAYGHNRSRLVNEGQRVKGGDQVAEMGRSGTSRDMLHFEIRYNGKPQDPLQALPKR